MYTKLITQKKIIFKKTEIQYREIRRITGPEKNSVQFENRQATED